MSSDGESNSMANERAPIELDLRLWSLADVIAWFDCIDDGKYEGRFTQVSTSLDFNGHKLLNAEDETLRLELQINDADERQVNLSHITVLRTLQNTNSHRELPALVLLDHHDLYVLAMDTPTTPSSSAPRAVITASSACSSQPSTWTRP